MRWLTRGLLLILILAGIPQPTLQFPVEAVQRSAFREALAAHPDDLLILEHWIAASIAQRQTEPAILLIRRAASLDGWTTARRKQLADLLAESDSAQAAAYWRTLLDSSQADMALLPPLVAADLRFRNWTDAAVLLNRWAALDPANATALYELAILSAPADNQAAIAYVGRAAIDPALSAHALAASRILSQQANNAPAVRLSQLGLQLIADSQWPLAEFILNRAAALDADNIVALALIGLAQDEQGFEGWPSIQGALSRAPDDPTVNYAAALHWRLAGDLNAALVALQKAESHDPRNPAVAAEIGTVYRLRNRPEDAALWFDLAVRLAPQEVGFQQLLATFYADENYLLEGDGLTAIQKAAQAFPNDAELQAALGQALLATGQFEPAQAVLERAVKLDSSNVRARFYRAVLRERQTAIDSAQSDYLYVYQHAADDNFRALAERALQRLGHHS